MTKAKVIGFKKFRSKKGNDMCVMHLAYDFSEKEVESLGARGENIFSGFTPRGFDASQVTEDILGAEVEVEFSFYNNQQNLVYLKV